MWRRVTSALCAAALPALFVLFPFVAGAQVRIVQNPELIVQDEPVVLTQLNFESGAYLGVGLKDLDSERLSLIHI